jgi:hypothetical protein
LIIWEERNPLTVYTDVVDWTAEKLMAKVAKVVRDGVNFDLHLKSDCCIRTENDQVVIEVTRQTARRITMIPREGAEID